MALVIQVTHPDGKITLHTGARQAAAFTPLNQKAIEEALKHGLSVAGGYRFKVVAKPRGITTKYVKRLKTHNNNVHAHLPKHLFDIVKEWARSQGMTTSRGFAVLLEQAIGDRFKADV